MQIPISPPQFGPPEPPKKNYTALWILAGLLIFLFLVAAIVGIVLIIQKSPLGPTGFNYSEELYDEDEYVGDETANTFVKMENELESWELDLLKKKSYFSDSEELITYYDKWGDQSEICILTNKQIIYDTKGHITTISLDQIETVKKYEAGLNDIFIIIGKDKSRTKIEIYESEGSAVFNRELQDVREKLKK